MKIIPRIFCCLLFVSSLHAQKEFFVIKNFDVQIEVNKDAYFDVIETIQVEFSEPRRGIYRAIPYRYSSSDGHEYETKISNISVDNSKIKKTREKGILNVRIGDKNIFVDGLQEYVIRYRIHNAFFWAENHTEFYWNLTGDQWKVPIENVAYSVKFPDGITLTENDYQVYTGPAGSTQTNATVSFSGQNLYGTTNRSLKPYEGVTVAAKLPKGSVEKVVEIPKTFWEKNNLLGIPTAILAFFSWLWFKMGRNRKLSSTGEDIYYPPQGYTPAEMGTLIDNQAHTRDIIALLPWWAEQGLINIRNRPTESDEGLNMRLERLKDLPEDAPDYQQTVYNQLFKEKDVVFLNEFNDIFYTSMARAQSQVKKTLKQHELYDRTSYRIFHSGWMIAAFVICVAGGIGLMIGFGQIIPGIIMLVIGILALSSHFVKPKLSEYGSNLMSQLYSFRETIKNPNREVINDILKKDPKYFEYIFPYAIAFGLDNSWLKKTDGLFETPMWYGYYGDGYSHGHMTHNKASFQSFTEGFQPKEIQQVFTSAPAPPPGSSGGGGGGFSGGSSGGGFGGGGGGSW